MVEEVRQGRTPLLRRDGGQSIRTGKGARGAIEAHERQIGGERPWIDRSFLRERAVEPRGGGGEKRFLFRAHVPRVFVVEALHGEGGGEPTFRSGGPGGGFGRPRGGPLPQALGPCRDQHTFELGIEVDDTPQIVEEQAPARCEVPRHRRRVTRAGAPIRSWAAAAEPSSGVTPVSTRSRRMSGAASTGNTSARTRRTASRISRAPASTGVRRPSEGAPELPKGTLPVADRSRARPRFRRTSGSPGSPVTSGMGDLRPPPRAVRGEGERAHG